MLGPKGNTITLAHLDEPCIYAKNYNIRNKHRFHGLEHDSKMRLFTAYSHTSTLRGYEASGKMLYQKTSNEERKTRKRVQNTPANSGIDRRESYHFRRLARETGAEKRKTGTTMQKNRNNDKLRKRWGRRRKSQKPREQNPKRSQKRTRTRYVRNPTCARGMGIVPHPAGATSIQHSMYLMIVIRTK